MHQTSGAPRPQRTVRTNRRNPRPGTDRPGRTRTSRHRRRTRPGPLSTRTHTPGPNPPPPGPRPYEGAPSLPGKALPKEPAADVQAALTALTRAESRTHVDPREQLDLHRPHLAGAQLHGADLTKANLGGATLTDALLSGVAFTGPPLRQPQLLCPVVHRGLRRRYGARRRMLTRGGPGGRPARG
ncbi:pentapeptide repeat-containing protein [Streptomyces sp. NPDC091272]|uniref:pentapeptide repeat-containing protein n=1 Tax=Streptomyces sp. NPDC091272 TaxID=3365981 RepID=UPI00380760DB